MAGLEPNATNLLLQTLARSVLTRKESSLAVRKVLKNEKPPKNDTKGKTFVASSASGQRKSSVAKPIPRPSLASSRSNPVTTTKSKLNSTQVRDGSVRRSSNERLIKDPASGNHLRSESSRSLASSASRTTPKTAVNRDGGDDTLVSTKPSSSGGHRTRPSSRAGSAHRPPPPGLATTPDQSSTELANHSTQSLEITQKSPSPDAPELSLSDQIAIDKASAIQQLEESLNVQSSSSVQGDLIFFYTHSWLHFCLISDSVSHRVLVHFLPFFNLSLESFALFLWFTIFN